MERHVKVVILFLVFILSLSGCRKADPKKNVPDNVPKTLHVVSPFGKDDGFYDIYNALVWEFEENNGIAVINDSEIASERWKQDVIDSFAAGNEPDVLFFFHGLSAESLIESGNVISLDEIRSYRPGYAMNISQSAMDILKADDGLNYCVPASGYWEGTFINWDLFESHGLEIPKTFEDLKNCIQVFRENGIIPVAANLKTTPHYWFEYAVYNFTGPINHAFLTDWGNNLELWTAGLELIRELYELNAFPDDLESVTDEVCLEMFNNKEAAIMLGGSWSMGALGDTENVRVIHFPYQDGAARKNTDIIGGFSMGYYITEKGWKENRDASIAFVEFMTGRNALEQFNSNGSVTPGVPLQMIGTSPTLSSVYEFLKSSSAIVPAIQDTFKMNARDYLFSKIIDIVRGNAAARDVLQEFAGMNAAQ